MSRIRLLSVGALLSVAAAATGREGAGSGGGGASTHELNGKPNADQAAEIAATNRPSIELPKGCEMRLRRGDQVIVRSNRWAGERAGVVLSQLLPTAAHIQVKLCPEDDKSLVADNGGRVDLTLQSVTLVKSWEQAEPSLRPGAMENYVVAAMPGSVVVAGTTEQADGGLLEAMKAMDQSCAELRDRMNEIAAVAGEAKGLRERVEKLVSENNSLVARIAEVETRINTLKTRHERFDTEILQINDTLSDLQQSRSAGSATATTDDKKTTAAAGKGSGGGNKG